VTKRSFCGIRSTSLLAAAAWLLVLPVASQAAPPDFELAAVDSRGALLLFRASAPRVIRSVSLQNLGAPLLGIDTRSADGRLYGLTAQQQIVRIDPQTGATEVVSRLGSPFDGGAVAGFDFNPQVDRLRLVTRTGQNLRVNVDIGAVAIDTPLRFAPDDDHANRRPNVSGSGYSNAVPRAARTITFAIDDSLDLLVKQEPPNDGLLRTVGSLGIDCGPQNGFDIGTSAGQDRAFLACNGSLFDLDLRGGRARLIDQIGPDSDSREVKGLAVIRPVAN
jgi:trimeric autotransporter adhesin